MAMWVSGLCVGVCVCVCERGESERGVWCVSEREWVCVCVRESERDCVCVCVCERGERESVCV